MKRALFALVALLLLAAPGWAGDFAPTRESEVKRLWPGGGYIIVDFPTLNKNPDTIHIELIPKYEHKIIPESELEKWLNEGWELVKAYTTMISGVTWCHVGPCPYNKAVIKRRVP